MLGNVLVVALIFVLAIFASCTNSACPNPIHDACSEKAAQIAPELAQVAAQQHKTAAEMTTEFLGVCEGQLQQDLDQTLPAILAIVDAGKDSAP